MTVDSQRSASTVHADRGESRVNDTWLGPVLVVGGVLTPDQLAQLAATATALWPAVVGAGLATDAQVADAVARRFRVPLANLAAADSRTVTLVPESLARKHQVVPLSANDRTIQIASADPRDLDLEQTLRFITGRQVSFQVAAPAAFAERIDELYRPERSIERLLGGLVPSRVEAVDAGLTPAVPERDLEAPLGQ